MARPFVVVVPHDLGREEARRRLDRGLTKLGTAYGGALTAIAARWEGDRLHGEATLLGLRLSAVVEVAEDTVRMEAQLPTVLALVADRAKGFVETEGRHLLRRR